MGSGDQEATPATSVGAEHPRERVGGWRPSSHLGYIGGGRAFEGRADGGGDQVATWATSACAERARERVAGVATR